MLKVHIVLVVSSSIYHSHQVNLPKSPVSKQSPRLILVSNVSLVLDSQELLLLLHLFVSNFRLWTKASWSKLATWDHGHRVSRVGSWDMWTPSTKRSFKVKETCGRHSFTFYSWDIVSFESCDSFKPLIESTTYWLNHRAEPNPQK